MIWGEKTHHFRENIHTVIFFDAWLRPGPWTHWTGGASQVRKILDRKKGKKKDMEINKSERSTSVGIRSFYPIYIYIYFGLIQWIILGKSVGFRSPKCSPGIRYPWTMARNATCGLLVQTKGMSQQWRMEWPTQQRSHKDQLEVWDTNTLMPLMSAKSIETKM